jgi:hypothetical protein
MSKLFGAKKSKTRKFKNPWSGRAKTNVWKGLPKRKLGFYI